MSYRIECVVPCCNHLGEGPIWDLGEGVLYWVDGTGRRVDQPSIWRYDPRSGATRNWSIDHDVGAMALRRNGGAVLALDDGFYLFDFESESLELVMHIDEAEPRSRLNDGKVDRKALPTYKARPDLSKPFVAPTSPIEKKLRPSCSPTSKMGTMFG